MPACSTWVSWSVVVDDGVVVVGVVSVADGAVVVDDGVVVVRGRGRR